MDLAEETDQEVRRDLRHNPTKPTWTGITIYEQIDP
jgi:hypothetical protein